MRWIHVAGAIALAGLAFLPAVLRSVRYVIWIPLSVSLGSGIYNLLTKLDGVPKGYHMWFGIKTLLVMHVFSIYFLIGLGRGDAAKHKRWAIGIAISALLAIGIGEYLRYLRLHQ